MRSSTALLRAWICMPGKHTSSFAFLQPPGITAGEVQALALRVTGCMATRLPLPDCNQTQTWLQDRCRHHTDALPACRLKQRQRPRHGSSGSSQNCSHAHADGQIQSGTMAVTKQCSFAQVLLQ